MFQGFPEIKEALISNRMQAGFMVAPMARGLRVAGVDVGRAVGSPGTDRQEAGRGAGRGGGIRGVGLVAGKGPPDPRARWGLRGEVLLRPGPETAALGIDESSGPGDVRAAHAV